MTVYELLQKKDVNNEIKERLLCFLLKTNNVGLFINKNTEVKWNIVKMYIQLLSKVLNECYPLQYITKEQSFYNNKFYVNKNVLIPRIETERIIDIVVSDILWDKIDCKNNVNILDVGTGSGCIAISLDKNLQSKNIKYKIIATDISQKALYIAKKNAKVHNCKNIFFKRSDLLNYILSNRVYKKEIYDIIIANLPYVKKINKQIKHEPSIALIGGGKYGLNIINVFLTQLKYIKWKFCILEMDPDQINILLNKNIFNDLIHFYTEKDLFGINRFIILQNDKYK